jgi:hypothetical protein
MFSSSLPYLQGVFLAFFFRSGNNLIVVSEGSRYGVGGFETAVSTASLLL